MNEVEIKLLAKKFDDLVSEVDPFGDRFSQHEVETIKGIWRTAIEAARQPVPEQCPVCGADCAGANPPIMNCPTQTTYEAARDRTKTAVLQALLREARQYVSDAGSDDDNETKRHSEALLSAIDEALR